MAVRVVTQEVITQRLTVGAPDQPGGITIYDRATKEPVCVFSENGTLRSEAGVCGAAGSQESGGTSQETTDEPTPEAPMMPDLAGEIASSTPPTSIEPESDSISSPQTTPVLEMLDPRGEESEATTTPAT